MCYVTRQVCTFELQTLAPNIYANVGSYRSTRLSDDVCVCVCAPDTLEPIGEGQKTSYDVIRTTPVHTYPRVRAPHDGLPTKGVISLLSVELRQHT